MKNLENINKGNGETLLLIDDESTFVEITRVLLTMAGYEVLTAYDGIEGIEILTENMERIDAVVCDLNMPKLGGRALIQKIMTLRPDIKILIISGSILDKDIPLFLIPGQIEFLQKPYLNETMLTSLARLLGKDERTPSMVVIPRSSTL